MAYILDSTDFSTVNASVNTAIATPLPQGAVNFYYPTMAVNTWYRYYNIDSTNVYETGSFLRILSGVGEQNGIIQKLSNLIVGSVYTIQIDFNLNVVGTVNLLIYSGTILQSTHVLSGSTTQTIEFTAKSTQDTIILDTENSAILQIDTITITTPPPTTPYLTGFTVKPASISALGYVMFTTDGVTEIKPNESQCLAYGYTYDKATGTCRAYNYNTAIFSQIRNETNKITGVGNVISDATQHSHILGDGNTNNGYSRNTFLLGENNTINQYVNNSLSVGTKAVNTATNSIVLGGNSTESVAPKQSIQLLYGLQSTDGSNNNSYLNGIQGSLFAIPDNSIMYFHADIVAVRVGGVHTHGANGDFASWVEKGVIINKSGVVSIERVRDTIKSSGTVTGWIPTAIVSGTNFAMRVKGHTDMTIEWASDIKFTQIKTGVTL